MTPYPHQIKLAEQGYAILRKEMLVYLAMEERTGKTLTALLIAERAAVTNILIITKKKALKGWGDTLDAWEHTKSYTVTTYGQAHKFGKQKWDLVILDEAHNYISGYPKPSSTWKKIKQITKNLPLIYLSATPHAQGYMLVYHQLALSTWSPFVNYSSFYNWHRAFGRPYTMKMNGREVNKYDRMQDKKVCACIEHLFICATRKQLGFEHEPKDNLHYIELADRTKECYNTILKDKVVEIDGHDLVCDTVMKLRTALHMIEGGGAKLTLSEAPPETGMVVKVVKQKTYIEDITAVLYHAYLVLPNIEKIQYILETWGDTVNLVIMYQYISEGIKLAKWFKNATILQATSFAEGVDLSMYEDLVIYSQDFSTARHTQRRARQANMERTTPIPVHYLLVKKGISEQVYNTVSVNKTNYVDSVFQREEL